MHISRRALGGIAAATSMMLALTACASGGDGDSGDGGAEAAESQDLTVGAAALPISLDAQQHSAEGSVVGPVQHVLEPLLKRDGEEFIPRLAESWENPDDLTWVFHIDPDATFSDGTPVTAEDARASIERLIEIGGPLAPLFEAVSSIEATDDKILTIKTEEPLGTLLTSLSLVLIGQGANIADESYWRDPVGSGRFIVDEFIPDQRLVLVKNEDYWGEPAALDSISYVGMPEETARISALATGEVDVIGDISADSVPEIESLDDVTYNSTPSYQTQFIWFNHAREPFDDPRVRQALWHAVDLEQIVPDLYGSQAEIAQAPVTQAVFGATQLQPYEYDPERARELLAEAGYPDGFSTTMQFSNAGGDLTLSFAQAAISAWSEIGVTVEPLGKEHAIWVDDLVALNWDMNSQNASTTTGDANYALGRLYTCEANRMGYCNEEYDELVTAADASVDQNERLELYANASEILWEDAVAIFVADKTISLAHRDYVQNVEVDAGGRNEFGDVTITEK